MGQFSSGSKLSTIAWSILLTAAIAWYAIFRVAEPLRHDPFTPGFSGNDFKHIYLGASMLVHGQNPYDPQALLDLARNRGLGAVNPYVYLPFTGLVISPLTLLDPPEALRLWFCLNHLLTLAALALIFWSLGLQPNIKNLALFATTIALCYPLHRTLTAGQLNSALLFLFALVFALEKKRWFIAAGAVAALAFLFKLIPGVLLLYFIWRALVSDRKYWRAAASMCIATAILFAISIAWVGLDVHQAFRPVLSEMGYGKSTWAPLGQHFYRDPANQSFNSLFHHLFAQPGDETTTPWLNLGPATANHLTILATILCWGTALMVGLLRRRRPKENEKIITPQLNPQSPVTYSLFILLALLTPSIYWDHYAVIALFPFFAVSANLSDKVRGIAVALMILLTLPLGSFLELPLWETAALLGAALALLCLLAIRHGTKGLIATAWAIAGALLLARFLFDFPPFRQGPGLLVMSIKLWGTLILFVLCLIVQTPRRN